MSQSAGGDSCYVRTRMAGGSRKALPFLKAKVSTNRQKAYSMSSGNAYGAERHRNVNKHVPTNVHTDLLVYTHTHTQT